MPSNWPRCNRSHAGDQTGEGAIRATPLLWSIDLGVVAAKSPVSRARQRAMVIIIRREPPPLRIDGIVNLALNLLDQGSPQEALPLLETALALAPASARARLAKARALNDLGRASEIGFLLDGLQPSDLVEADAASLNDIANGLSRLREFAAALPLYQLCKSISAPSAPILHNEGGALVGDPDLGRKVVIQQVLGEITAHGAHPARDQPSRLCRGRGRRRHPSQLRVACARGAARRSKELGAL